MNRVAMEQRNLARYRQVLVDLGKCGGDCDALARMLSLSPYYTKQLVARAGRIVSQAAPSDAQVPSVDQQPPVAGHVPPQDSTRSTTLEALILNRYDTSAPTSRRLMASEILAELGYKWPDRTMLDEAGQALAKIFGPWQKSNGRKVYDIPPLRWAESKMAATQPVRISHQSADSRNMLKIGEVGRMLQVSRATVYNYVKRGDFPAPIRVGKHSRWIKSEVADYIEQKKSERTEGAIARSHVEPQTVDMQPAPAPEPPPPPPMVPPPRADGAIGAEKTRGRMERLSIAADAALVDLLRARQDEVARQFGLHVSMSQVACQLMRMGLDAASRGRE